MEWMFLWVGFFKGGGRVGTVGGEVIGIWVLDSERGKGKVLGYIYICVCGKKDIP